MSHFFVLFVRFRTFGVASADIFGSILLCNIFLTPEYLSMKEMAYFLHT
jgi:hypothetical protein